MYMKRLLFSSLLALMAIAGGAQTFTVDDLSYTVTDADAKTVSVKKTDATTGELVIPSSVTYEEETYAVTAIENNGFAFTGITSITIPSSILNVGNQAFNDCDVLTSITIEDSETPLGWNGGYYQPLWYVDANYTLYLGRDLTTEADQCYFGRATNVVIGDKVTTINNHLFDGASRLASVTMGSGVTSIGAYAFQNSGTDESVEEQSISLGANVETISSYAFHGCSKLTSLNLGTKLTAIPEEMLGGCTALTSITIPASVLSVGYQAFDNCDALTSITIEDSDTPLAWNGNYYQPLWYVDSNYTLYLGRDLTTEDNRCYFWGATSVVIGDKVTTINNNLFDGAPKLASVTMGNGVTTIGAYAFQNSGTDESIGEQSISLGANVETIGNRAFYGCNKLTTLDLGTKLTAIPTDMLLGCTALTSITIRASVQSVGATAFNNCDALTAITIEDSDTPLAWNGGYYQPLWDVNSNYTLYLGRDLTTEDNRCYFWGATNVVIGDKVTTINNNLFEGAPKLSSVTMGNGVTTISAYAFQNSGTDESVGEQSFSLGANVETIGNRAFYGCTKLTTLDLGTKLTAIPADMLVGCTALNAITIPASVQSVGTTAFNNCDALTAITIEDSDTPLSWNGGYFQPLWDVNSNYTLYLGRDLTTEADQCYFAGATSVEVGPKVTTINNQLFKGASKLASVTMGSGVTTIGSEAFSNTGTDESVEAQSISLGANVQNIGNYAFSGCTKLTSIDLGTTLTAIPEYMLASCTALTSITIPASVLSVGTHAFDNCDALTTITIEDSESPLAWNGGYYQPLWAADAKYTLYLGRELTTEANQGYFAGVTSVEVGPQVTTITPYLFQGSTSLAHIDMTNATNLTTIGNYAFDGAGNGDSVDELTVAFGSSLTTIGARAFNNCDKIKSLTIPANVTTIESNAFWNMGADITVTIEDSETPLTLNCEGSFYTIFEGNPSISAYVGRNILRTGSYANQHVFDGQLTSVTIGPKVTAIDDKEYYDCDGLLTVSGMENVVSIGLEAFRSCNNLTSVELGTKLATMGDYAFKDCQHLESIVIPGTLKKTPTEAFENCFALASVTLNEGIEEIGNGSFYDTDALTEITIPASVKKVGRAPFYCNNIQVMKRMIIADSDEPLEFANGTSEYNWGRGNMTDDITLDYFYLGRDVNRVYFEHSLVYGAKEIEIGPKVTTISETKGLFYATDNVESVKVHALIPFAINDNDFDSRIYTNATLLVPGGTKEVYAAADGWKKFTNIDHWSTLVTLTATDHGSIATAEATANNSTEQYRQPKNDAVVYTLTANEGYELTALTDNDVAVSPLPALGEAQTRANADGEEFVTLNASFMPITYTLTYELAGGEVATANPTNYTIETATFTLTNPTREGYDFTGWKLDGEGEAMMTVTIAQGSTGHLAYTATWTPTIYNIVYTMDGGTATPANPTTYTIETETFTLTNPTKTGYTFKGWKLNGEGDAMMEVSIAKGSTGNKAYTATWQINQYTITFNSNGGSDVDAITQDYDSSITAPEEPTREGYTFSGWLPAVPATMPAEHMTCVAQWTVNQYTITFNTNGGSIVDAITQDYSSTITAPADPTREGYEFAGWDKAIPTTMPAENVTITANWTPITYTIVYHLDGGTVAEGANPEEFTIETESFTLVNPTREYYDFKGWTGTKLNGPTMTVTIAKGSIDDREYTATWEKCTYNVSITGAGVTASNYQPKYGDNVTISIEPDEDRTLTSLTVNGVDVTAQVANNQYTIENVSGNVTVVATFASTKEFITLRSSVATFSCSQDLDFTTSDLKAYIAAGYNKATNTTLLVRVYDVPAGTGLLLKGNEGATYKIPYVTSSSYYVNLLKANLEARNIPQTEGEMSNFMLNKNDEGVYGFYRPSATSTLGAQKAYLQVPTSFAPAHDDARVSIVFEDEDTVTNIEDYELFEQPGAKGLYNLQGLRVKTAGKGIYIENGKKVVKK